MLPSNDEPNPTNKNHCTFLLSDSEGEDDEYSNYASMYPSPNLVKQISCMTAETEVDSLLLGEAYFSDEPAWERVEGGSGEPSFREEEKDEQCQSLLENQTGTPYQGRDDSEPAFLEVAPGLNLRLRNSDETMKAVKIGFITCSRCLCCGDLLHCIQDADFVFCYDCSIVNPVDLCSNTGGDSSVALGMKDHELAETLELVYGTLE